MSKKSKDKSKKKVTQDAAVRGTSLRPLLPVVCVGILLGGAVYGLERLKGYVYDMPVYHPAIEIELVDAPDWVVNEKWEDRILATIETPSPESWMDENLTRTIADQLAASGWVNRVERVAKRMDGTIEVKCDYRRPIAMLKTDDGYVPIDREGYRMPEMYREVGATSGWLRIRGVRTAPPAVNGRYQGEDARAAVRLASLIFDQGWDFSSRISLIDVSNFRGQESPRTCHITLYTVEGVPVNWGSAIGEEIEENTVTDKLSQISVMLKRGGPRAQVDVSMLPHRSLIPVSAVLETADIANRRDR